MCKMLDQYADKIKGIFSFFDRMNINGNILPLTSEYSRSGALYQLGILYKDFKTYAKHSKEDAAREALAKSPVDDGLICVWNGKQVEIKQIAFCPNSNRNRQCQNIPPIIGCKLNKFSAHKNIYFECILYNFKIFIFSHKNIYKSPHISHFTGYTCSIKVKEDKMKAADKYKRIRTAPKGAWESGIINEKENRSEKQHLNDISTDFQGNGYPLSNKNQDK